MCICIVVHCQLFVSFFIVCLLFSSLVELLCYNDAMISRLQQRVPAKHLRLVQLLRIRLRQVMLQYRVAWFQRGGSYPRRLWTFVSSCFSYIFWLLSVSLLLLSHYLPIYLSIYTTTNNKHQAPTSSPTTSDPTIVSILIVWCVAVGVYLLHCNRHSCMSEKGVDYSMYLILCMYAFGSLFIANLSFYFQSFAGSSWIYLSIYTTMNNKHQAPTSSPSSSYPTVVSILIVWCVAVGVQLHWGLFRVDLVLCTCAYASLFIANSSSHSSSSACFSRPWLNCSATMTQWSVAFNKESQPSTYG
jgi:hypothetical protein